jgi:hypothetical protein
LYDHITIAAEILFAAKAGGTVALDDALPDGMIMQTA